MQNYLQIKVCFIWDITCILCQNNMPEEFTYDIKCAAHGNIVHVEGYRRWMCKVYVDVKVCGIPNTGTI